MIKEFGSTEFCFKNFVAIEGDTTRVISGWQGGSVVQLYKLTGDDWNMVPIMCLFHTIELFLKHHMTEITKEIYGDPPPMQMETSTINECLNNLVFNLRNLYNFFLKNWVRAPNFCCDGARAPHQYFKQILFTKTANCLMF